MKQKKILDENLTFTLDFSVLKGRIIIESYIPSNSSFSVLQMKGFIVYYGPHFSLSFSFFTLFFRSGLFFHLRQDTGADYIHGHYFIQHLIMKEEFTSPFQFSFLSLILIQPIDSSNLSLEYLNSTSRSLQIKLSP